LNFNGRKIRKLGISRCPGVAGVCNKAMYLEDRRRAFEAWASYLDSIISSKNTANVVKLRE